MEIPKITEVDTGNSAEQAAARVQEWLIAALSKELNIQRDSIVIDQPILASGVDSVHIVSLMANLEDWGGFRFSGDPLEDHPTIQLLSQYVSTLMKTSES